MNCGKRGHLKKDYRSLKKKEDRKQETTQEDNGEGDVLQDGGIPKGAWTGKNINYSFLRTFGCEAFAHIDKQNITKIEAKSNKCTFIGCRVDDFGYHLWDLKNHK